MKRERPWRAVASYRLGPGFPAVVMGRCYRATRDGLDRFITEHEAAGYTVTVWKVQPIPEVAAAARAAAQAAPLP